VFTLGEEANLTISADWYQINMKDALRAGVKVVAFGPHVDAAALDAATEAGAAESLPRSRFFARLPRLLSPPV
jgi:hypothetical protein